MTKPANSAFSKNRLRDITAELRRHGPLWATRLSRVKTEQEFLQTVCELFNLANSFTTNQSNSLDTDYLSNKIGLFISDNIHKGVTLKLLSQFLGYSEKYCSDLFHNTMGDSFSDYLKHRRLERATLLLTATEKGMAEIASLFRHEVSNLIQFVGGTCSAADLANLPGIAGANCFSPQNVAATTSQGFELESGARPTDWLYFETGYMYLDSKDDNTGQYLFNRSRHAWKTRMNVTYEEWTFTTRARYFSSFGFTDANGNGRIDRTSTELAPSNVQIDMRLSRTLKDGLDMYVGADNITESRVPVSTTFPLEGQHLYYVGLRMTM